MFVAADWGSGQVLWSFVWFFAFAIWMLLVFSVFADIMRARRMSGLTKGLWAIAIVVLPYLGVFLYLTVNGRAMNERANRAASENGAAVRDDVRQAAGSTADQLTLLSELFDEGKLTDVEFAAAKARVASGR